MEKITKFRPKAEIRESYGEDGMGPRRTYIVYFCPCCGRRISKYGGETACDMCGTFYDWGKSEPVIIQKEEISWGD